MLRHSRYLVCIGGDPPWHAQAQFMSQQDRGGLGKSTLVEARNTHGVSNGAVAVQIPSSDGNWIAALATIKQASFTSLKGSCGQQ